MVGNRSIGWQTYLPDLKALIDASEFRFLWNSVEVAALVEQSHKSGLPDIMGATFRYLAKVEERGTKPNRERQLLSRFTRAKSLMQAVLAKSSSTTEGELSCLFPMGGIQSNSVNRLLLMSSSEHHLQSSPMAFFIQRPFEAEHAEVLINPFCDNAQRSEKSAPRPSSINL